MQGVGEPDTTTPCGFAFIPGHRGSPVLSPTAVSTLHDSDQSLTIEWHLSNGNVRSEPKWLDPQSSGSARIARYLGIGRCNPIAGPRRAGRAVAYAVLPYAQACPDRVPRPGAQGGCRARVLENALACDSTEGWLRT
jgi:hypothetical protein